MGFATIELCSVTIELGSSWLELNSSRLELGSSMLKRGARLWRGRQEGMACDSPALGDTFSGRIVLHPLLFCNGLQGVVVHLFKLFFQIYVTVVKRNSVFGFS